MLGVYLNIFDYHNGGVLNRGEEGAGGCGGGGGCVGGCVGVCGGGCGNGGRGKGGREGKRYKSVATAEQ